MAADTSANEILAADDLKVWFPIKRGLLKRTIGHVKAVDGVTVKLRAGQTVGVVGESGSGKTTLGLALLRLQSSEGAIRFDGKDIHRRQLGGYASAPPGNADCVSRPVRQPQPTHDNR